MRTLNRLLASFAFVFAALIAVAFSISRLSSAAPSAATLYVALDGVCGGSAPCYSTVQTAVDAANDSDQILIAAGVYTGVQQRPRMDRLSTGVVTQVVYLTKTVSLFGGYTTTNWLSADPQSNLTVLDAESKGRVLYITGNISPTIAGLKIMRGNAAGLGGGQGNGPAGGGLYIITATVTLTNNVIVSNAASFSGGGLQLLNSASQIFDDNFEGNTSAYGGGLIAEFSPALISGNLILNNQGGFGGGVALLYVPVTATNNLIISNSASSGGGGVFVLSGDSLLKGNRILSNTASTDGGGVHIDAGNPTFINTVIADNRSSGYGSGVFAMRGTSHFIHTTIARNGGGDGNGLYIINYIDNTGHAILTDTIIANQSIGITVTVGPTNTAILNGVLWYNNGLNFGGAGAITVTNAVTGNPSFALDGYHLLSNSAAIDAGVNAGIATDIDGKLRIGRPDLGAVEYGGKVFLPLTLKNN